MASTGLDSSIDVFEVGQLGDANDAPEFELRAQDDVVLAVDWLPDSTGFVTLNKLGDAVLWDVTGASLFPERIPLADYPLSFAFLDQDRLALSGFVRAGFHDLETGTSIATNGTGSLERTDLFDEVSAAAPFIGRTLGPGIGLEVRDLATGEQLLTLSDWDRALGFSPAADRILVSTSEGGIGSVYGTASYALVDLASGRPIFTVPEFAQGGAFSPDGSHLVVSQGSEFADLGDRGGAPTLVVYDTATGNELRRLEIDYLTYEALEISDDGRHVAVGGQDGVVVLYDFDGLISDPESAEIARTRMSPPVIGIGFAGGGAVVLASVLGTDGISAFDAGAGLTPMWHADTGEQVVDSVMHDGLAWVPRLDASGVGLIGIDIDPANYADFARSRSTRALSAAECAAHLGEACPTGST